MSQLLLILVLIGSFATTIFSVMVFNRNPMMIKLPLMISWTVLGGASAWTFWVIISTHEFNTNSLAWMIVGASMVFVTDKRKI